MNLQVGDLVRNKEQPYFGIGRVVELSSVLGEPGCTVEWEEAPPPRWIHWCKNVELVDTDRVSLTPFGRAFHHIGCIAEDAAAE